MSVLPADDPSCSRHHERVALVIEPRPRDLGAGFTVRRVLPARERRAVGPFVFFDEMGPVAFPPGGALEVRPHPHIGLATVTYLFEGEVLHRDSLGTAQPILPGAVNWMTAGRGIVHSERTSEERRASGARLHGIQAWVALPKDHEDDEPAFAHHPVGTLPVIERDGARLVLIAGSAYGERAPVEVASPLFYVHAELEAGATLALPDEHEERAAYLVSGSVRAGAPFEAGRMIVFSRGEAAIHATERARVMLLGGAALDGPRHIEWNFVSSSKERIEEAKRRWREGGFPKVPGDEVDFIPLPE